jgi:hypothetical protein
MSLPPSSPLVKTSPAYPTRETKGQWLIKPGLGAGEGAVLRQWLLEVDVVGNRPFTFNHSVLLMKEKHGLEILIKEKSKHIAQKT